MEICTVIDHKYICKINMKYFYVLELQIWRDANVLCNKYNAMKMWTEGNYTQELITKLIMGRCNLKEYGSVNVKQV
jgi:hypothetical protein